MYGFSLHRTKTLEAEYLAKFASSTWDGRKKKFASLLRRKLQNVPALVGMTYDMVLVAPFDKLVDIYYDFKDVKSTLTERDIRALKSCFPYDGNGDMIMKFIESHVKISESTTCPYCDCEEIFIGKDEEGNRNYELDHYLDKGTCPIVALSLYNLIPVCHLCNRKKGQHAFGDDRMRTKLLSPFNPSYDFENHAEFEVVLGTIQDTAKNRTTQSYEDANILLPNPDAPYGEELSRTEIESRYYSNKKSKKHQEMVGYFRYISRHRNLIYRMFDSIFKPAAELLLPLPSEEEHRKGMRVPYDKYRRDIDRKYRKR